MRMPLVCAYCSGGMSIIVLSTLSFPGRDAARSSCEALLRRTGIVTNIALCTAPALQRTAPQELRAALRPGNERVIRGLARKGDELRKHLTAKHPALFHARQPERDIKGEFC